MDKKIAATLIVEMVGILAKNGYEDTDYNEAVAMACSALLAKDINVPDIFVGKMENPNEP